MGIPPFSEDDERDPPAKVGELKRWIREADAVLFVTPEYDYSIPGVLKNAIDWASPPYGDSAWSGKPAAVMGVSTGALGTARGTPYLSTDDWRAVRSRLDSRSIGGRSPKHPLPHLDRQQHEPSSHQRY